MENILEKAVEVVRQGGIIIFPTDTAFGIGCRMDNSSAVEKLFTLRNRPQDKAVPVLFSSISQVKEYVKDIPEDVEREIMMKYWPGAVTVVLPTCIDKVPSLVRGGGDTLGVRIPNHDIPLSLIKQLGVPLLGPSANFAGGQTPFLFKDINPELSKLVDLVIPGECLLKQASTVINCTVRPWQVIREGAVKIEISEELRVQN